MEEWAKSCGILLPKDKMGSWSLDFLPRHLNTPKGYGMQAAIEPVLPSGKQAIKPSSKAALHLQRLSALQVAQAKLQRRSAATSL